MSDLPATVTLVTQTRVMPENSAAFTRWQDETSRVIAEFPGFLAQTLMPPSPPGQVDWVILQRFATADRATAWLRSPERLQRLAAAGTILGEHDDVHIVRDGAEGMLPSPASVVISTHVKPEQTVAYRAWLDRIAAVQTRARGFQGYRFEPPLPGVQDDWLSILRFDTEENLQAWLSSPERNKLLEEATPFVEESHVRIARTGFDQWFPPSSGSGPPPAAWKMNMIVLLTLYPIVCLFSYSVQRPLLIDRAGLPFAFALFLGNIVSVLLTSVLVPWASRHLNWWLQPTGPHARRSTLAGAAMVVALYAVSVVVFLRLL